MFGQNTTKDNIEYIFARIRRDAKALAAEVASREAVEKIALQASNPKKRVWEEKPSSPRRDHEQEGERATQKVKIEEDDEDEAWKFMSANEEDDNSHPADGHTQEEARSKTKEEKDDAVSTVKNYGKGYDEKKDEVSYIYIH